jgi:hypothetical protein
VELIGGVRSAGDEAHLWSALAPFVQPGGEMIWLGEDDRLWRWTFDGRAMCETEGRMAFGAEEANRTDRPVRRWPWRG